MDDGDVTMCIASLELMALVGNGDRDKVPCSVTTWNTFVLFVVTTVVEK